MMSLIALPTVRPLPACSGIMRVVAMWGPPPFQKISGLLITGRIGLLYISFLVHIKIEIFFKVIFQFI